MNASFLVAGDFDGGHDCFATKNEIVIMLITREAYNKLWTVLGADSSLSTLTNNIDPTVVGRATPVAQFSFFRLLVILYL